MRKKNDHDASHSIIKFFLRTDEEQNPDVVYLVL
jgi:hypothetical protein